MEPPIEVTPKEDISKDNLLQNKDIIGSLSLIKRFHCSSRPGQLVSLELTIQGITVSSLVSVFQCAHLRSSCTVFSDIPIILW